MKQFFFATLATLALTACSSVDDSILEPQIPVVPEKDAAYIFDFNVNCSTGYESNTRAIKEGWETGDRIFVFFAQNSNSYLTMTYDGSAWNYEITGDELNLAESGLVSAAYVPFLPAEAKPGNIMGLSGYAILSSELGGVYTLATNNATYSVQNQKVSAILDLLSENHESQFYIEGIDETAVLECDAKYGYTSLGFTASYDTKSETFRISDGIVSGYNACKAHSIGSGHAFYFNLSTTQIPTFTLNFRGTEYTYTASKTLENGKAYKLPSLDSGKWSVGNTFAKLDPRIMLCNELDLRDCGSYQIIADASDSEMNAATTNGIKLSPEGFPDVYAYIDYGAIKVVTQASKIQMEDRYSLFNSLPNVTSIQGINNLDYSKTQFIGGMFSRCESLIEIDLSAFTFENANIVSGMFERCTNLRSVDLSNFAPRDAYQMDEMFYDCPNLQEIRFGKNFVINSWANINGMFYNTATNSSELHIVCTEEIKTALSNPSTGLDTEKVVWHLLSDNVPAEWGNGEKLYLNVDNCSEAIKVQIEVNATDEQIAQASSANGVSVLSSDFSSAPIYAYLDSDKTLHIITSSVGITMPSDCSGFFANLDNATSIQGIENLDFSNTQSMAAMFAFCLKLNELVLGPNFMIPESCSMSDILLATAAESSSCQVNCSLAVWSKLIGPSTNLDRRKVFWYLSTDNVPAEWVIGQRLIELSKNFGEATSVKIEVNATESQIAQATNADGVRVLSSVYALALIYAYLDSDKTLHITTSSVGIKMPNDCSDLFAGLINATSIQGIENLDFSNTKSMDRMFAVCVNLTELWLGPKFTIPEDCSMTDIFAIAAQESSSCQIHCSSEVWAKFIDSQNSTGLSTTKISHVAY